VTGKKKKRKKKKKGEKNKEKGVNKVYFSVLEQRSL